MPTEEKKNECLNQQRDTAIQETKSNEKRKTQELNLNAPHKCDKFYT